MKTTRIAIGGLHRGENPQPGAAVVDSLRAADPEAFIVGLAYNAYESGIFGAGGPDIVYTIPYPTAGLDAFLSRMAEIQSENPVDWILPTLDAEIMMLSGAEEKLKELGVGVVVPAPDTLKACSKSKLRDFAANLGLKTPSTSVAKSVGEAAGCADRLGYPVFLKGPYYDASLVETREKLIEEGNRIADEWGAPLIVQKPVRGTEFNAMGMGDGKGGLIGLCCVKKLLISSKGKGVGSVVVRDPRLEKIAADFVNNSNWIGPFELELIKEGEDGDYNLIEINPRFPAWAGFPTLLGANFPAAWVNWMARGESKILPDVGAGHFFLRHQIEVTGNMADIATLLSSGARPNWARRAGARGPTIQHPQNS